MSHHSGERGTLRRPRFVVILVGLLALSCTEVHKIHVKQCNGAFLLDSVTVGAIMCEFDSDVDVNNAWGGSEDFNIHQYLYKYSIPDSTVTKVAELPIINRQGGNPVGDAGADYSRPWVFYETSVRGSRALALYNIETAQSSVVSMGDTYLVDITGGNFAIYKDGGCASTEKYKIRDIQGDSVFASFCRPLKPLYVDAGGEYAFLVGIQADQPWVSDHWHVIRHDFRTQKSDSLCEFIGVSQLRQTTSFGEVLSTGREYLPIVGIQAGRCDTTVIGAETGVGDFASSSGYWVKYSSAGTRVGNLYGTIETRTIFTRTQEDRQ